MRTVNARYSADASVGRPSGPCLRWRADHAASARQNNAVWIAVTAYTTNETAIGFYQLAGFTPYTLTLKCRPEV